MNWLIVVLRFLHIGVGVFWAGSVFTVARFVMPLAATMGPDGQRLMRRLTLELGLTRAMIASGFITVLAGLAMLWYDSAGFQGAYMRSGMGVMLSIGGLSAIGALMTGIQGASAVKGLARIADAVQAKGGAPSTEQAAELATLGAKLPRLSRATAVQLAIAVLCMAVARYIVF